MRVDEISPLEKIAIAQYRSRIFFRNQAPAFEYGATVGKILQHMKIVRSGDDGLGPVVPLVQ